MGYSAIEMVDLPRLFGGFLVGLFRSHAACEADIIFLRQQLLVLNRSAPVRLRLRYRDRLIYVWFYRLFPSLLETAIIFKPETLLSCLAAIDRQLRLAVATEAEDQGDWRMARAKAFAVFPSLRRMPRRACCERVPIKMATAEPRRSSVATTKTSRSPDRNDRLTSEPKRATPSTLPDCRMALRTPAAMPERDFSTLPKSVDVSGGTKSPRPPPMVRSWAHIAR
jgi:hypothetical protein